jgi:hypothetical protein
VYGGKGGLASLPHERFLPIYDSLVAVGYIVFFMIVLLGFAAGLLLLEGRQEPLPLASCIGPQPANDSVWNSC